MTTFAGTSPVEVSLVSDGGSSGSRGAGAAVVRIPSAAKRFKLVSPLDGVNGTDAEVAAGLIGIAFLRAWSRAACSAPLSIRWESDSEHVVRFGRLLPSLPERRREPLWLALAMLTDGWSLVTRHVPGHSGHRPNESCDRAATWIQARGERLLAEHGTGPVGRLRDTKPLDCWFLLDVREPISTILSSDALAQDAVNLLIDSFDPVLRIA